jgi:hypothetical protein
MGPFTIGDAELVNGKRLFKLTVIGGPEPPFAPGIGYADVNGYGVALSTSPSRDTPTPPDGWRILAYSWTFLIPRDPGSQSPRLYPYILSGTEALIQHNWDYDRPADNTNAGLSMITPERTIDLAYNYVSGDNQEINSAHVVGDTERNTTWLVRCWTETSPGMEDNMVTFWVTDQEGRALPMFTRSTTTSPP